LFLLPSPLLALALTIAQAKKSNRSTKTYSSNSYIKDKKIPCICQGIS